MIVVRFISSVFMYLFASLFSPLSLLPSSFLSSLLVSELSTAAMEASISGALSMLMFSSSELGSLSLLDSYHWSRLIIRRHYRLRVYFFIYEHESFLFFRDICSTPVITSAGIESSVHDDIFILRALCKLKK